MVGGLEVDRNNQVLLLDGIEFLVRVFRGPVTEWCPDMISLGACQLAESCPDSLSGLKQTLMSIACMVPESEASEQWCAEQEIHYVRLFINAKDGIPAPPYESCHVAGGEAVMGEPAVRMRQRLEREGLEPVGDSNEPPDHLCIELEYLYYLFSNARFSDASAFARDVMLPWTRVFAQAVSGAEPDSLYDKSCTVLGMVLEAVAGASN